MDINKIRKHRITKFLMLLVYNYFVIIGGLFTCYQFAKDYMPPLNPNSNGFFIIIFVGVLIGTLDQIRRKKQTD